MLLALSFTSIILIKSFSLILFTMIYIRTHAHIVYTFYIIYKGVKLSDKMTEMDISNYFFQVTNCLIRDQDSS